MKKIICDMCTEKEAKYVQHYQDGPFFMCPNCFCYHGNEKTVELIEDQTCGVCKHELKSRADISDTVHEDCARHLKD